MRNELLHFLDSSDTFEARGLRLLLEYFFANDQFRDFYSSERIGISVFGSARIHSGSKIYNEAVEVGRLLYESGFAVVTGASSGVMEGANRGVAEAILKRFHDEIDGTSEEEMLAHEKYLSEIEKFSIGLKINLPYEKEANPYLGNMVSFHYFAIRKFYFTMLSRGFIRMEGGWGTRDEFWEMCTLVQTGKAPLMPIISLNSFNEHLREDFSTSIKGGFIGEFDKYLVDIVDSPEAAVEVIKSFYRNVKKIDYTRDWEILIYPKIMPDDALRGRLEGFLSEYPGVFKEIRYEKDRLALLGYTFKSFGYLRRFVDRLNGLE